MKPVPRIRYDSETGIITKNGKPLTFFYGRGQRPTFQIRMPLKSGGTKRMTFQAARVAWALHYKVAPTASEVVIFKDGDGRNIRISNLGIVPKNQQSLTVLKRTNKTGYNGVWRAGKKYRAAVTFGGKRWLSSSYVTARDAYEAGQNWLTGATVLKSETV